MSFRFFAKEKELHCHSEFFQKKIIALLFGSLRKKKNCIVIHNFVKEKEVHCHLEVCERKRIALLSFITLQKRKELHVIWNFVKEKKCIVIQNFVKEKELHCHSEVCKVRCERTDHLRCVLNLACDPSDCHATLRCAWGHHLQPRPQEPKRQQPTSS